jgi:hypothetical protein
MKHDTFNKYPPDSLDFPVQALLTTWGCLDDFHDDLVLVGGLAVRFLTKPPKEGLPGPVTLDVDFGVNIGASAGAYPGILENLSAHDFRWVNGRFTRKFPKMELHIDLMTDDNKKTKGTAVVDNGLNVSIFPGIHRALACHRKVKVSGKTLLGTGKKDEEIKVAEVGPLLVLKLNAFHGRKAPKDVHDILYLAMNYLDGIEAAVVGFREERRLGNRGMDRALECIRRDFLDDNSDGPVSCAAFRLNNEHRESQNKDAAMRIQQDCVTLARALME